MIKISLPFGNKENVKDLIFTILTKEYPLRIIDLMNLIKKRYGKSVTFQAVRKAIFELKNENVLLQEDKKFLINKDWIFETKRELDEIYLNLTEKNIKPKSIDSIKGEVSVFLFDSLGEMMKFWQKIIDDWYTNFKKGDPNVNSYQGAHGWEGLLYADYERKLMSRLRSKGIKSYALSMGSTPLDKYIWRFYSNAGLKVGFSHASSSFDKSYYVATYGETIVQSNYPTEIVRTMDEFFKKNKSIEKMDLSELSDIVNKKIPIKLTVIKDLAMAKQINKSIIYEIE
jgi:hypothetical protein